MQHSFDISIAEKYGVNVAIFLNNLSFWLHKNISNNDHYYDNYHWTYNTQEAFLKLFPYWTRQNLRTIIKKAVDENLIKLGNYNKIKYDRKTWYALTEKGLDLFPTLKSLGCNQPIEKPEPTASMVRINRPIADNKPIYKTTDTKSLCASDDARLLFEQFFSLYPRKKNKNRAWEVWLKMKLGAIADVVMEKLRQQVINDFGWKHEKYIPYPDKYLENKRWEDEVEFCKTSHEEKFNPADYAVKRLKKSMEMRDAL